MLAWACKISKENFQAIASEHPKFDLEEIKDWLAVHEEGYFVRDEDSMLDCSYMQIDVFKTIYKFHSNDLDSMFRQIDPL
jgi:hypothetical protein